MPHSIVVASTDDSEQQFADGWRAARRGRTRHEGMDLEF